MKKLFNLYLAGVLFGAVSLGSCSNNDAYSPKFKLTFNADTLRLKVGETATLMPQDLPEGATFAWNIDNGALASLDNGYVTALKAGQTNVRMTAYRGAASGEAQCVLLISEFNKTDNITFKDANLKALILAANPNIDANKDGEISAVEAETLTQLNLELADKGAAPANQIVNKLDGLEYFVNLEELNLRNHNVLNASVVSQLTKLKKLNLGNNGIKSIDVSKLTALTELKLYANPELTKLDLTNNNALETLYLQGTSIEKLDLTGKNNLVNVNANNCRLSSVVCSNLEKLERIEVVKNNLTTLTIENCPALQQIHANSNKLSTLKLTNLPELNRLNLYDNYLTEFSGSFPKLMFLFLYDNRINKLDVSQLPLLLQFFVSKNNFEILDLSNNKIIRDLDVIENEALTTINLKNDGYNDEADYSIISGNTALKKVIVDAGDEEKHVKNLVKNSPSISVVTE